MSSFFENLRLSQTPELSVAVCQELLSRGLSNWVLAYVPHRCRRVPLLSFCPSAQPGISSPALVQG